MPFLKGSIAYRRFTVSGPDVGLFDETHIAALEGLAAGRSKLASADGVDIGWSAGKSVLDTEFNLEKNIYPGFLVFDFRVDTDKLPNDLLKAYYEVELAALAANNSSGLPSARQKREAKESARDRLEAEAKDGRFKKRKTIPVLWCQARNEILFGSSALTHVDRFTLLFERTFGRSLRAVSAGTVAGDDYPYSTDGLKPTPFIPALSNDQITWSPASDCHDWLGNEFALWLWYNIETIGDTIELASGGSITAMIARRLSVDCPRGMTGRDGFVHEGPARLPEAKRAIQAGKLPRKLGLTIVGGDEQFEFTLEPESLVVNGGKLPPLPEDIVEARAKVEHRFASVVALIEAIDALYRHFLLIRIGDEWSETLHEMQDWLAKSERRAA